MRRKNDGGEGGGDSWLNTYADMVTLLLTFFAVLLSMSSVNQEKFNAFIKSFSNLPQEIIEEITNPAIAPGDIEDTLTAAQLEAAEQAMSNLYELLVEYVEKNGMSDTVSISKNEQIIFIKFDSSVFFEPDKYVMRSGGKDTLSFIGDGIKQYEDMINLIAVCGHTATVPDNSNSPVSDWILSGERAGVVAKFFEDEKGLEPKKMLLLGYGKNLPVASNDTEEGRMANRRVEIVIVGEGSDISFDPYSDLRDLYELMGDKNSSTSGTDIAEPSQSPETGSSDTGAEQTPAANSENAGSEIQKDISPYD